MKEVDFKIYNASGQNFIVIDNRGCIIDEKDYYELARVLCKFTVDELLNANIVSTR